MKIAVAMSGGIDSSAAAILLKNAGHEIIGITARFLPPSPLNDELYKNSVLDAKKIADLYNFHHYEYNFSDKFQKTIIDYFCREYLSGKTPNPCIFCNRYIKFHEVIHAAEDFGCSHIATGHYVIKKQYGDRWYLSMSPDQSKDQSYFLFMLTQEQISRSIFPLGNMTKNDIRNFAEEINLPLKYKAESQEICFIPGNNYIDFIENYTGVKPLPGEIVDSNGNIIGKHNGIHRYTIGQRRGMGIAAAFPLYVTSIDSSKNRITAAPKEKLFIRYLETKNCYHMKYEIEKEITLMVKTRSTQKPVEGLISRDGERFKVSFTKPQTGISPGQAAVFYDSENDIVGGGIIDIAYN